MSVLGNLKSALKGPTTEHHEWVNKVFGVDPRTVSAAVSSGSAKVMAKTAGDVVATVAKTAVKAQLDFDKGIVEGVIEGGKGLVTGTVAAAKAVGNETVALATDPKARADAAAKITQGAQAVGTFAKTVVTDPKKAGSQVAEAASSAGRTVVDAGKSVFKSYEEALAAGHGAEWVGKGVGQAALLIGGAALTDGGSLAAEGVAEGGAETAAIAAEAGSAAAARAAAEAAARKAAEKTVVGKTVAGAADREVAGKAATKAVDDAPKPASPKEQPKLEDPAEALKKKIDANLPKAKAAAKPVLEKAAKAEQQITKNVGSATEELGGKMIGLDTRLKTPESLERKIATDMATGGQSAEEVAANISDAVRYTASFPPDKLVEGAEKTLAKLRSEGNEVVQLKNTWLDPKSSYKGINVQMRSPDGQLFELQFHTPESFWAKDKGTHAIFEEMRKLPKDSPEWKRLDEKQREIVDKLVVPKGIEKLAPIKRKGP